MRLPGLSTGPVRLGGWWWGVMEMQLEDRLLHPAGWVYCKSGDGCLCVCGCNTKELG